MLKRFLWSWGFWATVGVCGCVAGVVFQKLTHNGLEVWLMGIVFLAAAYVERHEY
jgi:hypothetical protein